MTVGCLQESHNAPWLALGARNSAVALPRVLFRGNVHRGLMLLQV